MVNATELQALQAKRARAAGDRRRADAKANPFTNPSGWLRNWRREKRYRKSQKWDAMGATALKVALRDTTLVDAAWLVELAATEGGIVPRCQDVPKHAKVSLKEMEKWPGFPPSVAVLVIS